MNHLLSVQLALRSIYSRLVSFVRWPRYFFGNGAIPPGVAPFLPSLLATSPVVAVGDGAVVAASDAGFLDVTPFLLLGTIAIVIWSWRRCCMLTRRFPLVAFVSGCLPFFSSRHHFSRNVTNVPATLWRHPPGGSVIMFVVVHHSALTQTALFTQLLFFQFWR